MNQKMMIIGLFFLFVFLFGFWLSRTGKPYNVLIFNAHKLIGLAMGIFLIMTVYRGYQTTGLTSIQIVIVTITVFLFIILVAAGGFLSAKESVPLVVALIHKVFPYLAVFSTAAMLYLLLFTRVSG
jgi:hypothetical protein